MSAATYDTYDLETGARITGGYARPEAAVSDEDACAILADELAECREYMGRAFGVRIDGQASS